MAIGYSKASVTDALGLAALVTVMVAAPAGAQGNAGPDATRPHSMLLLGVGPGDSRTIAVDVIGDSVAIRSGTGLIVPRKTGFWRVGVGSPTREMFEYRGRALAKAGIDSMLPDVVIDSMSREEAAAKQQRALATTDSLQEVQDTATASEEDDRPTNFHGEPLGEGSCFAQWVWTVPLGRWPSDPAQYDCEDDQPRGGEVSLTFVGPEHVSMYLGVTDDVSYSFMRESALGSLDVLAAKGVTGNTAELGNGGWPPPGALTKREVRRCAVEFQGQLNDGPAYEGEPDEYNTNYRGTIITRTPGRWIYARYYALTSYVGRGWEWNCDMKVPVPKSVTGWDSLTVPWTTIKRKVPAAVDAYSSPRGDVVIVTTPQALVVYRTRGGALGAVLGRAAWESINPFGMTGGMQPGYMVMSQWAVGQGAERWAKMLAPLMPRVAVVKR